MRTEWGDPPAYAGGGGPAFPRMTVVTRKLLWINAVAFGALFLLVRFVPALGVPTFNVLSLSPRLWWEAFPLVPFWQLASYGFMHSPSDVFHVLFNMLALYFFGTMVEGIVGGRRFLVTYLIALLLGGVAQLTLGLVMMAQGVAVPPTLGASGAVMCVIVAAAVMMPETRVIFILFPLKLRTLALILVGIDVFRMLSAGGSNVAWLVHLTGAAYGFLAVRRRWIWSDPLEVLAVRREVKQRENVAADRARLDALLKQIHNEGIHSLSRRDKEFLKRQSRRD